LEAGIMGFVVLFAAAWLSAMIVYSMEKSLSILENAFIFLLVLIIGINVSWIVGEEFKLMKITKDGLLYAGFILERSIVVPIIYVILMNAVYSARSVARALLYAGVALGILLGLRGVLLFYRILEYDGWNLLYDAIQIVLLQALIYALVQLYRRTVYER
jgi:hypothetical protein